MDAEFSSECVRADRSDRADRPRGEERDSDRRIRQDRVREGTNSHRRGVGRDEDTAPAVVHDIASVHPGLRAVMDRRGRRGRRTPTTGHRCDHGNGVRHALCELAHSGFVLRDRATIALSSRARSICPAAGTCNGVGSGVCTTKRLQAWSTGVVGFQKTITPSLHYSLLRVLAAALCLTGCMVGPEDLTACNRYGLPALAAGTRTK